MGHGANSVMWLEDDRGIFFSGTSFLSIKITPDQQPTSPSVVINNSIRKTLNHLLFVISHEINLYPPGVLNNKVQLQDLHTMFSLCQISLFKKGLQDR